MTRRHTFQIHVCPLCMAPCEVEGGYDGPYFVWTCDHEHVAQHDPQAIDLHDYMDPEAWASYAHAFRQMEWAAHVSACHQKREALAERDWRSPLGPAGLAPDAENRRKLTWTPADRKLRARWRALASTDKFSETLKRVWLPSIRENLNKGRLFLAAFEHESMDAHIDAHRDFNRQAFGERATIPIKRKAHGTDSDDVVQ